MLTLKARNTYNNIVLQGQLTGVATSHPRMQGGARPQKGGILAGNDILNGMTGQLAGGKYSFKNFTHDVGNVYKAIPQPVKDMAMKAATDAAMAAVAAGRSDLPKGSKKAKAHMNGVRGVKLVKGSQQAKDYMAKLRAMKKK